MHPGRADDRMTAASPRGEPYKRAIMTSLWRTFSPPPQDWPLALLDYRSVDDAEGEPNLLLFVDKLPDPDDVPEIDDPDSMPAGSIFAPAPRHRWWFFPDLTADEALLFKLHDSDHSVAWRCRTPPSRRRTRRTRTPGVGRVPHDRVLLLTALPTASERYQQL